MCGGIIIAIGILVVSPSRSSSSFPFLIQGNIELLHIYSRGSHTVCQSLWQIIGKTGDGLEVRMHKAKHALWAAKANIHLEYLIIRGSHLFENRQWCLFEMPDFPSAPICVTGNLKSFSTAPNDIKLALHIVNDLISVLYFKSYLQLLDNDSLLAVD